MISSLQAHNKVEIESSYLQHSKSQREIGSSGTFSSVRFKYIILDASFKDYTLARHPHKVWRPQRNFVMLKVTLLPHSAIKVNK